MKEFDVTITETLKLTVSVEASSKEEAQQMVSDQWHAGDHILDADNFVEVEFESNDGREISAERAPDDTIEVLMVEPARGAHRLRPCFLAESGGRLYRGGLPI